MMAVFAQYPINLTVAQFYIPLLGSALFFGIEATQPLPELGFVAKSGNNITYVYIACWYMVYGISMSGIRLVLSIATRLAAARGTMLLSTRTESRDGNLIIAPPQQTTPTLIHRGILFSPFL